MAHQREGRFPPHLWLRWGDGQHCCSMRTERRKMERRERGRSSKRKECGRSFERREHGRSFEKKESGRNFEREENSRKERFNRRLQRFREHHDNCKQRLNQRTSQKLDNMHEESERESPESEFSTHSGSDPEYSPAHTDISSDEAVEGPDTESREDKDQQTVESPTSTSAIGPQKKKIPGREEADVSDEWSDHLSSERPLTPDSSDIATTSAPHVPHKGQKRAREEVDDDAGPDKSGDGSSETDDRKTKKKRKGKERKGKEPPQVRRPWTESEKIAVKKHLGRFMAERRIPGKQDCVRALQAEKVLCGRTWRNVKDYVYNRIVTLNRRAATRKHKMQD